MNFRYLIAALVVMIAVSVHAQDEFPCGIDSSYFDYKPSYWTLVEGDDGKVYPCNAQTGERKKALSPEMNAFYQDYDANKGPQTIMTVSPDGKYLIFTELEDGTEENPFGDITTNSYNTSTGKIIELGVLGSGQVVQMASITHWYNETTVFISYGGMSQVSLYMLAVAHLDVENSLEDVIHGFAQYIESPPRYEYLVTDAYFSEYYGRDTEGNHTNCVLEVYQFETGTITYDLGYDCLLGGLVHYQNYDYFLRVDSEDDAISELVRLDVTTGDTETVYEGEIEAIEYAEIEDQTLTLTLIEDNSGKIDSIDNWDLHNFCLWTEVLSEPQQIALQIDHETDELQFVEPIIPDNRWELLTIPDGKWQQLTNCLDRWLENNEG